MVHSVTHVGNAHLYQKLPDAAQSLAGQALDPWASTPGEFGARLKADYDKYAQLIRLTGARVD
jgi:tripartite-type tricarboxylate transporter receptor subunit TctC